MATTSRPQDLDVSRSFLGEELREHPGWFHFFQAVRLMHRMLPDRDPVGRFAPPSREVLRFSANNLLAFPPSQIQTLDWPADGPARMKVNFMGLTGPMGVLPYSYTDRKSTRLNSSHLGISYAVFCLKKKKAQKV